MALHRAINEGLVELTIHACCKVECVRKLASVETSQNSRAGRAQTPIAGPDDTR